MRATGRRITRRVFLAAAACAAARGADAAGEVWEFVMKLAAALERGNADEFMRACDPAMPGYADLRVEVAALAAQADAESAIDPVKNDGDERARDVEVDWSLHLRSRSDIPQAVDRRSKVRLRVEKRGREWKAVSIEPLSFFAPPSA